MRRIVRRPLSARLAELSKRPPLGDSLDILAAILENIGFPVLRSPLDYISPRKNQRARDLFAAARSH